MRFINNVACFVLFFGVFTSTFAQSDSCSLPTVLASFQAAALSGETTTWEQKYIDGDCPLNVKRSVRSLARGYSLLVDEAVDASTWIEEGQVWSGIFHESGRNPYKMILTVETITETRFTGTLLWPDLSNSMTAVSGYFVTSIDNDTEQTRWSNVENFNPKSDKALLVFTETKLLQGSGIALNGFYYAVIDEDGKMRGVWYRNSQDNTTDDKFTIEVQEPT